MIEVEVLGLPARRARANVPDAAAIRELCRAAAARAGMHEGHLAVAFVDAAHIAQLNAEHRNEPHPTDVLSFPVDGAGGDSLDVGAALAGAHARHSDRELGDVVICLEHTSDVREAIVHGVLHLAGMDHETDDGEMLALQSEILDAAGAS
jgi:probable rRNA maturation factor